MSKSKILIPHEHGGWAMISVPFMIGMMAAKPSWIHLVLFAGWLLLYLCSYPMLQAVKRTSNRRYWIKWGISYGVAALACLVWPLTAEPALILFGIPLLALLTVNVWHTKHKSERAIVNDLCAIAIFSIGGSAAYLAGQGGWDWMMAKVWLFSFLYFAGSALFVKTMFRMRTNRKWIAASRAYHFIVPFIPLAIGIPVLALSFIFPAARAFAYAGKLMKPMKVGIIEIVGSVQFMLLTSVLI